MTCHRTAKPRSAGTTPTDIVTYRYNGNLVYVPVTLDYDEALTHARAAFPQLKGLCDASLSLSLPGRGQQFVGISAPAWPKIIAHMARYQIIDVQVTSTPEREVTIPDITIVDTDAEQHVHGTGHAPPYCESNAVDGKTSHSRPQSLPVTFQSKRSWFFRKLHRQ